jgi:hypothetical protein
MKRIYLYVACLFFSAGQLSHGQEIMERVYEYDNAGNRIIRKVLVMETSSTQSNHKSMNGYTGVDSNRFLTDNAGDIALKIYPNPTTSKVTLQIETSEAIEINGTVTVYNQSGSLLGSQRVSDYRMEIDMSVYPSGIYPVVIQINGKTTNWKIIKQ